MSSDRSQTAKPTRTRRRWRTGALAAVGAGLIVAHLVYWYGPRERPGLPRVDAAPTLPIPGRGWRFACWLPYPHQNLAALARRVDDLERYLTSVGRLLGVAGAELPRFGPLPAPPAEYLAFGSDGEDLQVEAHVYPLAAVLARWAGRLGDNPWLAGGEVALGGRSARVGWRGRRWSVVTAADLGVLRPPVGPSALVLISLERPVAAFPPGDYRLARHGQALELRGGFWEATDPWFGLEWPLTDPLILVAVSRARGAAGAAGVALFDSPGWLPGLPGFALFDSGGLGRGVPGEELLHLVGAEPARQRVGAWVVSALDSRSLALGVGLATILPDLVGPGSEQRLRAAVWLDPAGLRAAVARVRQTIAELPLVAPGHRRWIEDLEVVLAPMAGHQRLALVALEAPAAVRAVLGREDPGAEPPGPSAD